MLWVFHVIFVELLFANYIGETWRNNSFCKTIESSGEFWITQTFDESFDKCGKNVFLPVIVKPPNINPFMPLVHYTVHTLKLRFLSLYKCWLQSANEKSSDRSRDFFWFTSNASIGPTVQSVANNMERRR